MKKEEKRQVYHAKIEYFGNSHVTRECDPEDEWDRDDTDTNYSFFGFRVVKKDQWASVPVLFEPEYDKKYWLVYVSYDTGDSFGHDDNGGIEFIGLYRDREIAEENVRRIKKHDEAYDRWRYEEKGTLTIKNEGCEDQIIKFVPWHGYFERLNTVEAIPLSRLKAKDAFYK